MCGIAGLKGNLENKNVILHNMLNTMALRGPDNEGNYFNRDIALGHRRLKIIDLSSQGNQPMGNEDDSISIVCNGEIYNFMDLRHQLEHLGHRFKSRTDTEVILHGYEEWGKDCLLKIRGMFAFAIWDNKKKELFLARDRLGIKPLYYYSGDGVFIFASQVRAILTTGLVPKRLNKHGLISYLDSGSLKEPWTIAEGIYSLMPGKYLTLNNGGFKISRYWNLINESETLSYPKKIDDIRERINFLLKESIRLHLISDVPIGVFLSGGIDSSSLLSLASKIAPKIKSVSLVFSEKRFSESDYSRLIAKKFETDHQEVLVEDDYFLERLPEAIVSMDEPTVDGINTYFVSKVTKEAGLTVALSGLGGDELFTGYPSFKLINCLSGFYKFWDKSPESLRETLAHILDRVDFLIPHKDKIIELIKNGTYPNHPYFWIRRLFTEQQKTKLLKIKFDYPQEHLEKPMNLDAINQVSYLELTNYMRDTLLRDTDFMSMVHSLEVRVPFLDHKLVEFMLSVPGRFKMHKFLPKPLLVKSLDEPLPGAIVNRKKMGFIFPFDSWLRQNLKAEVENILQQRTPMLDEFLNEEAVSEIWQGYLKKRISWQRPWALYILKKWVSIYLQ